MWKWLGWNEGLVVDLAKNQSFHRIFSTHWDWRLSVSKISTGKGFLFIDGEYVPSPYEITLTDDEIIVNGSVFTADSFDVSSYQRQGFSRRHFSDTGDAQS